jgi:hypothetical protein
MRATRTEEIEFPVRSFACAKDVLARPFLVIEILDTTSNEVLILRIFDR